MGCGKGWPGLMASQNASKKTADTSWADTDVKATDVVVVMELAVT